MTQPVNQVPHWIDGRLVSGRSSRTAPVFNPATGTRTGAVHLADAGDVSAAVGSATVAAAQWRRSSLSTRSDILFAFRELVRAQAAELADQIMREHGKVLSDAAGEVARGLENVEFACGVPHLLRGGFSEQVSTGVDVYSIRQPLGVVAGITPFNFPVMVPLWMCANAIACGNAFILKPSERDPSASLMLARLWQRAGLPDGVFTVLQGDREAVDRLLAQPDVAAVSFVGSTPIARQVYVTGTANGKRVQALGGAKNHMVVLPDADIEVAADAAVSAAYGSAGERCMAVSVAVAVGDAGDRLVEAIAARLPKLRVGGGDDPGSDLGPLITAAHRDRVRDYIAQGVSAGATAVVDGRAADLPADGFFLGVTLLDRVTPEMSVYTDEIFGPVLCVLRAGTFDEAVQLVNRHDFGNGAAIFTRDGGAARKFQFEVEAGMVGVNVPIPVPVAHYSFGGWKASLFGDIHMYGPDGIQFYTRAKVVTSRWPDPATSTVDLGFPRTR
ncbi:MAG: malonate-semialdehyde dehydrogenase (acetylating) / methylmalonate-semialdehyde dehydrogenase [Mycobacteriales bacterium]|jgi:malonate-semialdehyde dehydrogenase (acetylating)/methylmalonate-semialdehyde dehydrogenase